MYRVWATSLDHQQLPSSVIRLDRWAEEEAGDGASWLCIQFDQAVTFLGKWVDRHLQETDSKGKSKYDLSKLLDPGTTERTLALEYLISAFGRISK
jgi:hypothetical protein